MNEFIPVNEPSLDGNEKAYLNECIDSGWISSEGPFVGRFEREIAARVGRAHGVSVANGTAALDVAVDALGLGPGDEVILPSFTIISCASAVVRCGATPVVVDADPLTWNMDVGAIEAVITPRTQAIMAVHIYGLPVDMDPLLELAASHDLRVIEDAAQALGQEYRGRPCGSFGDISTFSFYPNKHVTTGEGGMVVTNDESLAGTCSSLANLCFEPERRFVHQRLGYNYRMSNLQAAVGVAQLERLDAHVARKREIGAMYADLLGDVAGIQLPLAQTEYADNAYWVFGVVLDDAVAADARDLAAALAREGVGTRPFFYPMHLQPVFRNAGMFDGVSCPVAERLAERGLYLPSGLALTDEQVTRVAHTVARTLDEIG